jgi:phosphatidylglycerophosphate synthase
MLGSFLDPLADKILVATLFVSLTYVQVSLTLVNKGKHIGTLLYIHNQLLFPD